jgi:hypothetical protein
MLGRVSLASITEGNALMARHLLAMRLPVSQRKYGNKNKKGTLSGALKPL